jgi:citrate lyase subunit beta/citryl-CoA lyase
VIRSLLYVPAHAQRFVAKAHEREADAIILDLEDAVPPGEKSNARAALAGAGPSVSRNGALVFVRINANDDADAEAACRAGATGLLVPKTREPETLRKLTTLLAKIERSVGRQPMRLIPMIEDPGAVFDARAIGAATPRVLALMTGGEDMATALGAEPTPEALRFPKMMVHMAAKAVGVLSLGMIRTVADYRDIEAVARAAREARALGFDGASCIHPSVVPILNAAFSPSAEEINRAEQLVAAAEAAALEGKGAFVFDGKMVDEPVVMRTRALLTRRRR